MESKTYSKVQFLSEISCIELADIAQSLISSTQNNENSISKTSTPSTLPSLSVIPGATDESLLQSLTQNSFSLGFSMGPISPTEDSSEDHAEIDRTSTEMSADSVRLDQDILDSKTEDEAPDIDDDLLGISPAEGQPNYRPQSFEATEDTDITTPLEMRDSQERDSTNSLLESSDDLLKEKDLSKDIDHHLTHEEEDNFKYKIYDDEKRELDGEVRQYAAKEADYCEFEADEEDKYDSLAVGESFAKNAEEIKKRVEYLQERVESDEFDPDIARTEAVIIQSTVKKIQDSIIHPQSSSSEGVSQAHIIGSISNLSDAVNSVFEKLDINIERKDFVAKRKAQRTESTIVETGSSKNNSPSEDERVPSLSDLLDPEDIERESLEEEFEVLAAEVSSYQKPLLPNTSHALTSASTISSTPSSESVFSRVSTQQQPGMKLVCEPF